MASQAQKTQQNKMKQCARKWKTGDREGKTYPTHLKSCLKGSTGGGSSRSRSRSSSAKSSGGKKVAASVRGAKAACAKWVKARLNDPNMMGRSSPSTMMQNCLRRAAAPNVSVTAAAEKPPAMRTNACKSACEKDVAIKQADPYLSGKSSPATMMDNCMRRCAR